MSAAISIQHLSKKYTLSKAAPYVALRDVITNSFQTLFKKRDKTAFWALKDIDLEIAQGERIGIIGHNGAGKSTLLKIISRITPPTSGKVILEGRVASLLEVGTGFHPELTGRENIYLNGSILGLKKWEIDKRLEEIIDFGGVEKFIDTPLKHYSSGMQLRLAFSVAAHLEPEILLIDEVLAVGDMEFQKKCMGKMEEVSKQHGRTILFVSHNMSAIASLCNRCLLLNKGRVETAGNVQEVVAAYLSNVFDRTASCYWTESNAPGNEIVRLKSIRIVDGNHLEKQTFKVNEPIGIEMRYQVQKGGHILWLGHNIYNQEGINVFDTHSVASPYYKRTHEQGSYVGVVWIPAHLLNTGTYIVSSAIFNHLENKLYFHEREVLAFQVHDVFDEETARGLSSGDFPGVIRPLLNWHIEKQN